ncbi:hypothetical protein [Adhaeribacter pallidiroseus]|uniref:Uncharacterized protein n=1 Tax=Adhaeribacter pallidiroseus TaxID=2072847 RepID=A0A369QHA0_9BACT|nr:hypothetical protein [Adhaeribacter pallidiroseus]RDC62596.1 hypothetical protein AHMF7616_01190 [Adhaeribacter pallidiroseus]
MISFLTNLPIVLLLLLILNAALVFILKNPLRFIKGPFVLFMLLSLASLTYRFVIYPTTNKQIQKEKEAEINKRGWDYINDPDVDAAFIKREQKNMLLTGALFRIAGFQTAVAFILAVVGLFVSTDKKVYSLYALGFLVLAFIFLT